MRILILKTMSWILFFSVAAALSHAEENDPQLNIKVENEIQKRNLTEKSEETRKAIQAELDVTAESLKAEIQKKDDAQKALITSMKALTGAAANNFFTTAEAESGSVLKASERFFKRKEILNTDALKNANQDKVDTLEKAIHDLQVAENAVNKVRNEQSELTEKLNAVKSVPAVANQADELKVSESETNPKEKDKELVDLNKKIRELYETRESVINADPENDFTNLATLIQIYSKYIEQMKASDSKEDILAINQKLVNEREEFLKKLGRKTGRTIQDARFGTVDANFNSIQASQAYQQIFQAIDSDLLTIAKSNDVTQLLRAYKSVQLGLLGIKKMEDAREFITPTGKQGTTTTVPASSYYNSPGFNSILSANPKDLKYMLKQRRKNLRIYYKYR